MRTTLYDGAVVELGSEQGRRNKTGKDYRGWLICEIEADAARTMYADEQAGHPAGSGGMVHFKSWRRLEICPAGNDGKGGMRWQFSLFLVAKARW